MEKTRLSSKVQLLLPKAIRDARGRGEGTEFVVKAMANGVLLRLARTVSATLLENAIGSAGYRGRPVSTEGMARAVAKGVRTRRDRGRY